MTVPPRVFCDTSFFYACLDARDANHAQACRLLRKAVGSETVLSSTWEIVGETITLLRYRKHFPMAFSFLMDVKPQLDLIPFGDAVRHEAERVFCQFGKQFRLSFCDAISFVVVTTLLDYIPCLSFDRDFRRLGLTVLSAHSS